MDNKCNTNHYIYLFINSFLIYVATSIVLSKPDSHFVQLDNQISVTIFLLLMTTGIFFQGLLIYLNKENFFEVIFIILISIILLTLSIRYQILSVQIGYLMIILLVSAYFLLNDKKIYWIPLFTSLLVMIKIVWLLIEKPVATYELFNWELKYDLLPIAMIVSLFGGLVLTLALKIFNHRWFILVFYIIAAVFVVWLSLIVVARPMSFSAPNYDMGIFSQVFESMASGKGPMTSLERDQLQSHFAVHISPILYLALPFYLIKPSPEMLNFIAVFIVLSGLVPFYLIIREMNFNQKFRPFLLLFYLLMPALLMGHLYDFHENVFLAPLLLWLFYVNIKEYKYLSFFFVILVLMVKEDTFIYLMALGLYFIFQGRFPIRNKGHIFFSHLILPMIYFVLAINWLNNYGSGAMTGRFNNFMLDNRQGLFNVMTNALLNPAYTLNTLFIPRKMEYVIILMLATGCLPLMQRSWSHYFLLLPLLVINLLSNYVYQADLSKQYHFGSSVLLLLMLLLALEVLLGQIGDRWKGVLKWQLCTGLMFSSLFIYSQFEEKTSYINNILKNRLEYQLIHQSLAEIPRDLTVLAYSMYTPHLADIEELYDIFYHHDGKIDTEIDLLVFPRKILWGNSDELKVIQAYHQSGYTEHSLSNEYIMVLEK